MRLGLVGPAEGDPALVRQASQFLLEQSGADQVVYLGLDDSPAQCAEQWASELLGFPAHERAFLQRAAELACSGSAADLEQLLTRDRQVARLSALRRLPQPPARAVEMLESKVVLLVHDKAQLDAEDIANAFLVVYGRSKSVALNHFGPRTFFSPGPLKAGQVALVERLDDGQLAIAQLDFHTGQLLTRTVLESSRAKMVVQS